MKYWFNGNNTHILQSGLTKQHQWKMKRTKKEPKYFCHNHTKKWEWEHICSAGGLTGAISPTPGLMDFYLCHVNLQTESVKQEGF